MGAQVKALLCSGGLVLTAGSVLIITHWRLALKDTLCLPCCSEGGAAPVQHPQMFTLSAG